MSWQEIGSKRDLITVWSEPIWIKVSGWWQIPPQHQSTYLRGPESASIKVQLEVQLLKKICMVYKYVCNCRMKTAVGFQFQIYFDYLKFLTILLIFWKLAPFLSACHSRLLHLKKNKSMYVPKRSRICFNENPPYPSFQTSAHKFPMK